MRKIAETRKATIKMLRAVGASAGNLSQAHSSDNETGIARAGIKLSEVGNYFFFFIRMAAIIAQITRQNRNGAFNYMNNYSAYY